MRTKNITNFTRTALYALGFLLILMFSPFFAMKVSAQTPTELQAQIQSLLDTIAELQAQVAALEEPGVVSPPGETISTFAKNLRFGDRGPSVKGLQIALNKDPDTQIARSGPGSPGEETDFFGNLTKNAVIVFQEKYAALVLAPVGLSRGSGFVGPSTRAQLNTLGEKSGTIGLETITKEQAAPEEGGLTTDSTVQADGSTGPEISIFDQSATNVEGSFPTDSLSLFAVDNSNELFLAFPSAYEGVPGTKITLTGSGFTATDNTIHFGAQTIENIASPSGTDLVFAVPGVAIGRYNVFVSNTKGATDRISFLVPDPSAIPPKIDSISPESGVGRTQVTIRGEGFAPTNNRVYTSYGVLGSVASVDGKTIVVSIFPPNQAGDLSSSGVDLTYFAMGAETTEMAHKFVTDNPEYLWLYVENDNGLSNNAVYTYFYDKNAF